MNKFKSILLILFIGVVSFSSAYWWRSQIIERKESYQHKLKECEIIIKRLEENIAQIQKQSIEFANYKDCLKKCDYIKKRQIKWSNLVKDIAANVPRTIWLEKLVAQQDKNKKRVIKAVNKESISPNLPYNVIIVGKATQPNSIRSFVSKIDESDFFSNTTFNTYNHYNLIWQFQIMSTGYYHEK